jgi:hypothetical protein
LTGAFLYRKIREWYFAKKIFLAALCKKNWAGEKTTEDR